MTRFSMLVGPLATSVAGISMLALATPVHAAPATITDNGNGSFTVTGVSSSLDYLYFCPANVSAAACWNSASPTATEAVQGPINGDTFTVGSAIRTFPGNAATTLAAGSYRVITNNGPSLDATAVVTVYAGAGGGASTSGPAPVVQEFGKPLQGTCDAAAPRSLDWAGVASGGWSQSWSQWVNNGTGGVVCTRTLVYRTAQGVWSVA